MITMEQIPRVIGTTAYDSSHKKIGTVGHVYLDDATGRPEWLAIQTGLFGLKETFVPVEPAEVRGDEVIVPISKEEIKNAPNVDVEGGDYLPAEEESRLYEYYGTTLRGKEKTSRRTADDTMTLSEERMRVGKETRETGRARLKKYVVTEMEQQTVPVRREKVRVEREPITDERAGAMTEIGEEEQEVILHEERPVVAKETVAKERVRLSKEAETKQESVRGKVRKERLQTEGLDEDELR